MEALFYIGYYTAILFITISFVALQDLVFSSIYRSLRINNLTSGIKYKITKSFNQAFFQLNQVQRKHYRFAKAFFVISNMFLLFRKYF